MLLDLYVDQQLEQGLPLPLSLSIESPCPSSIAWLHLSGREGACLVLLELDILGCDRTQVEQDSPSHRTGEVVKEGGQL